MSGTIRIFGSNPPQEINMPGWNRAAAAKVNTQTVKARFLIFREAFTARARKHKEAITAIPITECKPESQKTPVNMSIPALKIE